MVWYTRFAHHTWIDVKHGDEAHWMRVEVLDESSGAQAGAIPARTARMDTRWQRDVRLLKLIRGERAQRIAAVIEELTQAQHELYRKSYRAWPGPNSNTLVADLAREIPELSLCFDPNAVGKDYAGWFSAGATASKTGVRVDTPPLGFAVGLHEGVELHFLGLTLGVSLVPPRLNLPFFPALPWEERGQGADAKQGAEIDYELRLQSDPLEPAFARQHVAEFARTGRVRFSAAGSANEILVEYQLLDPLAGGRAKLQAVTEMRSEVRVDLHFSLIAFDDAQQAELGEFLCGELGARMHFQRGSDGKVSGSLSLERR